jgi:hypothetical protein
LLRGLLAVIERGRLTSGRLVNYKFSFGTSVRHQKVSTI